MAFSSFLCLGVMQVIYNCGFGKGDPEFISVFTCMYTSIMHCFRYDVMWFFSLDDLY